MTASTEPSRTAERLLEALGADHEFRDGILGDLREEHALRVAWDGARAARRWYRREALRAAPHLLRDGVRRLGWRGTRRVAGAVTTAYLGAYAAHLVLATILLRPMRLLSGPVSAVYGPYTLPLSWHHPVRGPATLALLLLATALPALVSGVVAAALEDDAPVFAVLALVAMQLGNFLLQAWIGYGPTGPAWEPGPSVPLWVMACQSLLVVVGPVVGGVLCLAERARAAEAPRGRHA